MTGVPDAITRGKRPGTVEKSLQALLGSLRSPWESGPARAVVAVGMRLGRIGLLVRSLAVVTLGLIALFAGFISMSVQSVSDSTNRTLQERLLIARVTARELDEHLLQMATVPALQAASLLTEGGERTEETRAGWRALRQQFGLTVIRLAAIDGGGHVLWTSPYDEALRGLDLSGAPMVKAALLEGAVATEESESSLLPASLLGSGGAPTVAITSPVSSDHVDAVLLIVDLNQPPLADMLEHLVLGEMGHTEVVGRSGRVLATSRRDRLGVVSDHGGQFATLMAERKPLVGTCHDCHGGTAAAMTEDVLALAPLGRAPLAVVVRQPSAEAFAFEDELFRRALIFGAASFAAALCLSWLIVIRLVRPVNALTGACLRIAEGDLSQAIPPMGGGEIGILAGSFEAMRAGLRASREEIRRWGCELEQKVRERTAELEQARGEVQRSRDFLVTLFDSLEDELAVLGRDYRVVEANRALLHRYGDGKSLLGKPCYSAFHNADAPCGLECGGCPAEVVWRTGRPCRATHVHVGRSGEATYVDIVASPVHNGHGEVVNVLEVSRDITESKRLQEQVLAAVRSKEEAISSFLRKYMAAQEEERKRIARELHDDTAQSVAALAMAVETALRVETDSAAEVQSLLEPARPLAARVSGEINRIIRDLRPSLLDELGLLEALEWYADHRLRPLGVRVTFEAIAPGHRLMPELETALFRVAQEAMSNIARHAAAENVAISLEAGPDYLELVVEDDGCGFDVQRTLAVGDDGREGSPFGLLGMRERVNLLSGTLSLESRPGEGTSVRVRVPLPTRYAAGVVPGAR